MENTCVEPCPETGEPGGQCETEVLRSANDPTHTMWEVGVCSQGGRRETEVSRSANDPTFERRWTIDLVGQGSPAMVFTLTKGGAVLVAFRTHGNMKTPDARRMVWHLAIEVAPAARFRSMALSLPPRLLLERRAGEEKLDFFLEGWLGELFPGPFDEELRLENRRLATDSLLAVQAHLQQRVNPEAAEAAAVFPPDGDLRWWVYEKALVDPSGRVAQMVRICPGILLAARWMEQKWFEEGCRQIFEGIATGMSLPLMLEKTIDLWKCVPGRAQQARRTGREKQQRLRISRALPLVPPSTLMECPAGPVVPEDIPRDPEANRTWFEVLAWIDRQPIDAIRPGARPGIQAMLSRHATALHHHLGREWERELGHLLDYIMAEGRHPDRRTDPYRLIEASRRWHQQFRDRMPDFLRGRGKREPRYPPDQPLLVEPVGPFKVWRFDGHSVRFIETVGGLQEESVRMKHCVETYATRAVEGTSRLFHAEISGEPFTIQLVFDGENGVLHQASGVSNKRPGPGALEVINCWKGDLHEALQARRQSRAPRLRGTFEPAERGGP